MELSKKQKEIVEATEDKIVVLSRAATGKSRVLTERARLLLRKGIDPHKICVITFTNLAAQELRERLSDDYKDGIFIGTIHSLAYNMLLSYGIKCDDLIRSEDFDLFFSRVEENPNCIRHYEYVLLDEAQDSSDKEFNFIFNMIDPENFFVVGDDFQSIYSFRNAKPQFFLNLSRRRDVKTYELNENYRNAPKILNEAKKIISRNKISDNSVSMYNAAEGIYKNEVYSAGKLLDLIQKYGKYGDWAVLARTNTLVKQIQSDLSRFNIPTVSFKQGEVSQKELQDFMDSNKVKVLTIHSAKGLTFKYVGVVGAWWGNKEEVRLNYVAATRAQEGLFWFKMSPKLHRI